MIGYSLRWVNYYMFYWNTNKAIKQINNEYFSNDELYFMANPEEIVEYDYS